MKKDSLGRIRIKTSDHSSLWCYNTRFFNWIVTDFRKERTTLCPRIGPTLPESPNPLQRTSGDWLELIPRVEPQFLNSLASAIKSSPARDAVHRVLMCMCLVSVCLRGRFCDATVQTEGMWVERMSGCESGGEKTLTFNWLKLTLVQFTSISSLPCPSSSPVSMAANKLNYTRVKKRGGVGKWGLTETKIKVKKAIGQARNKEEKTDQEQ